MSNSKRPPFHRKKLYVNKEVQGSIIKKAIFQWFLCTSLVLLVVVIVTAINDPSRSAFTMIWDMWKYFAPVILASFFVLPIFVYDLLRASHKIAGPLLRLKNEMEKLTNGETVRPLRFRDGDYWQDMAEQFNLLAAEVQNNQKLKMLPLVQFLLLQRFLYCQKLNHF